MSWPAPSGKISISVHFLKKETFSNSVRFCEINSKNLKQFPDFRKKVSAPCGGEQVEREGDGGRIECDGG
jgi:hypothetical protein